MTKIDAPPEVLLQQEQTNRALALKGWGPTLRLKFLRSPLGTGLLSVAGGGGGYLLVHEVLKLLN